MASSGAPGPEPALALAVMENGGELEKAAQMANHSSTRTTEHYDRRADEVERIII